jgi:hypothetical protein
MVAGWGCAAANAPADEAQKPKALTQECSHLVSLSGCRLKHANAISHYSTLRAWSMAASELSHCLSCLEFWQSHVQEDWHLGCVGEKVNVPLRTI